MKSFLYVMVEKIPLLIDGGSVHEILPLTQDNLPQGANNGSASGHFDWRNQLLPIVNARTLLELPIANEATQKAGIVYQTNPDHAPIFLIVDEVVRILKLGFSAFVSLPNVPEKLLYLFDKVYVDIDQQRQAYCFRNPLPDGILNDVSSIVITDQNLGAKDESC